MREVIEILNAVSAAIPLVPAVAVSLFVGFALGFVLYRLQQAAIRKSAQWEAAELVQEAKDASEIQLLEEKERIQEIETELWAKDEKDMLKSEERIEELEELITEKKQKLDNAYSQERQKTVHYENQVKALEEQIQKLDQALKNKKSGLQAMEKDLAQKLADRLATNTDSAQQELIQQFTIEAQRRALESSEQFDEYIKEHSETLAKEILENALSRFARPYSAERGIAPVYFETPDQRRIFGEPKGDVIRTLEEITGCEIFIQDDMELIGVAGFDPVRRELTRRTLEKCLKEKKMLTPDSVRRLAENQKKEILNQIKRDGDNLAKELKLDHLHPEIRQMMGSLRFRYSFTQNQYFHCAEVGWLCGLLASELRSVQIKKARRSGLLHDLGKAMDHELEGGHAVIGAEFIAARNEAPDVVHAVKAHHYDEQPATDMAYLVIAADAISGARPGARRSTIESYNQKVADLENIAKSFDGVTDCFILSGGRECRVLVNGRRVSDIDALKLSQKIAEKIEAECSYPGHIKVVVVRETLVTETTKAHA